MTETKFRYFEFGEFRLDTRRRILQKNGTPIHLTTRSFDLLCVLVENAGRVLEHDELLDKVWEDTFVEQGNLKKTVSTLRQALGESPETSEFITTVPRRGYRFSAEVRPVGDEAILIRETRAEIIVEEEIEDETTVKNTPRSTLAKPRRFQTRQILFACGAALALATAAFAVWMFWRKPPQSFSVENVRTTKLNSEGMSSNVVPISADGKYIAYAVVEKTNTSLVVKQLATGSVRTIVPPQSDVIFWGYNFSPDSEYVYYIVNNFAEPSKSGLYRIPFLGGVPQMLFEKAGGFITFSPDGKRLAFTRRMDNFDTEIVAANTDGSNVQSVAVYDTNYRIWGVEWTPDGESLLCTIRKREDDKSVYYVAEVSIADGTEKIVMPAQTANLISAVWLPDKQSLLYVMSEPNALIRQIWQYFPSTAESRRVTNDNVSYWFIALTKDGKTFATVQESRPTAIWTADADLTNFRKITVGANEFWRAFWTADGKIAYQATENRQEAIWTMQADGTNKLKLTSGSDSYELNPRISDDGRTITFASRLSGNSQVRRIDTDGMNLRQLTNDLKTPGTEAKVLADGQTLIFSTYLSPTGWTLFKRTPGGKDNQLTNVTVEAWDVSPDGRLLVFSGTDAQTQKNKIYVQNLENGEIIKTFDVRASHTLRFTRDGKAVIFGSRREGSLSEIMFQPLDGSSPKTFDNPEGERIIWLDWSLDGKNLLVVRGKIQNDVVLIQVETKD